MARKIPGALWISIAALGAISLIQLIISVQKGSAALLAGVAVNVALLVGLMHGHKWAYAATLFFSIAGLVVVLVRNPENAIGVLIINGIVVVPMVMSTQFFFAGQSESLDTEEPGTEGD